ncbi:MAG: hypothetical protein DRG24_09130 [Epsilonproteobacteria bacterium]|nr:MAG: hypothetical protein DRG24_09130 [Campylobacterota bacterium]
MKVFFLFLAFLSFSYANNATPRLYSSMGDLLYAFVQKNRSLENDAALKISIQRYGTHAASVLAIGKRAEVSTDGADKKEYLQQLRKLQKEHNALQMRIKQELVQSMSVNNYARFSALIRTEPVPLMRNETFKQETLAFYKQHKGQGHLAYLDKLERAEKTKRTQQIDNTEKTVSAPTKSYKEWMNDIAGIQHMPKPAAQPKSQKTTRQKPSANKTKPARKAAKEVTKAQQDRYATSYAKSVIVLTTKTCPACKSAKKYFRSERIVFREYDVSSSREGKRLFRKHKGHAVPMIIVGEKVMTGLDKMWFKNNYSR